MKVKFLWVLYLPVILLSVIIKSLEFFGINQYFDKLSADYVLAAVISIFAIIGAILTFFDKETSQVYLLGKNIPAFLFSLLSAILISSKSFLNLFNELVLAEYDGLVLLTSLVGVIAAASFIIIALAHLMGKNHFPNAGMMFISIPVWFVLSVMKCFMEGRIVSAADIDPIRMFFYIAGSIVFVNIPMIIALIGGKKPVNSSVVYGVPFALLGVIYFFNTVKDIVVNQFDFSQNISGFIGFSTALYVLFLVLELIRYASKTDKNEYVFDLDNVSVEKPLYDVSDDDNLFVAEASENSYTDDYTISPEVASDFITETYDNDYVPQEEEQLQVDDMIVVTEDANNVSEDDAIYISQNMAEVFKNNLTSSDENNGDNIEKPINDVTNN